ncbi:pre-mRNA-splicing factor syf2 [Halocaridina rubra]|uniref:Pre-mRNA-splicing factor SYF2 n=1 Tax=Halocaridina rubra TaxID=373956 RepID=A0AAN8WMW1_HALRR
MAEAVAGSSKVDKMAEFKTRLAKLHTKRSEAAALNHKEVVEEDRVKHMPKNHQKKRERLEAEYEEEKRKDAILAEGKDYDRVRMLEVGADEAERYERKKKKKNPDTGFSTYEDATIRQYNRLLKNKKVDLEEYEKEKVAVGEAAFYGQDNTIAIGLHKDSKEAIDNMVDDLEKQLSINILKFIFHIVNVYSL